MFLRVFIPRYHHVDGGIGGAGHGHQHHDDHRHRDRDYHHLHGYPLRSHFVYQIEVSTFGRFYRVERRYSQFLSLHNELRKSYRTPDFPPKKLRNTSAKILEQRRIGLEAYLHFFVRMNPVPQVLLDFLDVPREDLSCVSSENSSHHAVIGFGKKEAFLLPHMHNDKLPDIIEQGTLDCFYKY